MTATQKGKLGPGFWVPVGIIIVGLAWPALQWFGIL